MADIDILSMPQAPGLGGGEYIPIVQGGVNKRTTAAAIADLAIVPSAVVWKDQVQYATTVALPTNIYDNGTGGVGATLTAVSNGPLQIDGLFQSMGDRVLIKNETPQANNGIYSVISAGSGSSPWQLERTPDFNQVSLIAPGDAVTVALGTSLAQTFWIETVFVTSVGSSPIIFSELFTPLTAGNGIEIDNFVVSIDPTVVATLTDNQTLTNKTLVDPAITGYTASEAVATDVTGAVVTIPNTGTGNNVLAISPVLTTPNLGVPSAIDLTNATNLPIGTLPKGTTDYPLVGNGSLAPSYRQVPIATGVAGLGAGVATFLGTPSSANLATAVTDETGIGSLVFSGSPALTGNPTAPTQTVGDNSTKIATTAYVQAAVSGTTTLPATKYGTIAALPTVTYANGSSGVGATLTATANGALSVDSSSPSVADAILVKNQASTFQNGLYAVTATGSGAAPFVLTRTTYYNLSADIDLGDTTFVTSGATLASTSWTQNGTEHPTIGTDPITFAQTAGPGSFVAGNGIAISGTSIAIDTSVTIDKTTAQTLSNKTLVSPVINGPSTGSGVATAATANTLMQRGANGNAQANVFIPSYTSTATAAGTTTLTVASTQLQKFTGTTTQTVVLPDVSTLAIGHTFEFNNQSTGAVTVESSGGNVLVVLAPGAFATVNSNSQTGTTAASWDVAQYGNGSLAVSAPSLLPATDLSLFKNIYVYSALGLDNFNQRAWSAWSTLAAFDPLGACIQRSTVDNTKAWVRAAFEGGFPLRGEWFGVDLSGNASFDSGPGLNAAITLAAQSYGGQSGQYVELGPGGVYIGNGNTIMLPNRVALRGPNGRGLVIKPMSGFVTSASFTGALSGTTLTVSGTPTGTINLGHVIVEAGLPGIPIVSFTGAISGNVLTVSGSPTGTLAIGQTIAGAGLAANTIILGLGTGSGGAGTYILNQSYGSPVSAEAMTGNVTGVTVVAFGTGSGGAGTYTVSVNFATPISATSMTSSTGYLFKANGAVAGNGAATGSMFGSRLEDMFIDARGVSLPAIIQSDAWQETCGMTRVGMEYDGTTQYGVQLSNGYGGASWTRFREIEIFPASTNAWGAGIRVDRTGSTGAFMLDVEDISVAASVSAVSPRGIDVAGATLRLSVAHFEYMTDSVVMDGPGGLSADCITGSFNGVTNLIHYLSTFTGARNIGMLLPNGASGDTILDDTTVGQTIPQGAGELVGINGPTTAFLTTLAATKTNVTGNGTTYNVPFDTVAYDEASELSAVTLGQVTFKQPGKVRLDVSVGLFVPSGSTSYLLEIGSTIVGQGSVASARNSSGNVIISGSVTLDVTLGQSIRVAVVVAGIGADTVSVNSGSFFSGEWLKR